MRIRGFDKRAQLTIFIVFGILILVGLLSIFLLFPKLNMDSGKSVSPLDNIRLCMVDSLENVLPDFYKQGLYFEPTRVKYLNYSGGEVDISSIPYYCYTDQKKTICEGNDAISDNRVLRELKDKISEDIKGCFLKFKSDNPRLDVSMDMGDLVLRIFPGKIDITSLTVLNISNLGGMSETYSEFTASVNTPLWDYIIFASDILRQEVSCDCMRESCTADLSAMMGSNPQYSFTFFLGSRGDRVYTIQNHYSNLTKFHFAVRNCVPL